MIERQKINGHNALVAYLSADMEPVDADKAELVKITFEDSGSSLWLVPNDIKGKEAHKPTEVAADTASALNGLAKRILAESHSGGANDQQTVSEDDIKNERLVAALGNPAVSSTDWLDQLRARIAEFKENE